MILTLDQIKEITVGAHKIWQGENGVIAFAKCTDKQVDAWNALREVLGQRARTTTGIRFDLHTDAEAVKFTLASGAFDLLINGVLIKKHSSANSEELYYELPSENADNRVTLVFPSHGVGTVYGVELIGATYVKRHEFDKKLLFFGDSITQGHKSDYDSISYAYQTSFFFNAESMIQGIGGAIFHESTFDPEIDFDPETVIVAYGTNDFGYYRTLDELRLHVSAYLDLIKEKYGDKKVICLSPIWRGDDATPKNMGMFSECRGVIIDEITKRDFIHIDGYTLTPHDPWFYSDAYLHPNATGFGIYALNLVKELQKYL